MEEEYRKYVTVNGQDEYSRACVDVGELIAAVLDNGESPADALKQLNGHGLTGFMATMAVKGVAHFHPRGEELLAEWNKQWGVPTAQGLVNPAVMNVSDDGKMTPDVEKV